MHIPVGSRPIYTTIIDLSATQNITTMRKEQMRNLIFCYVVSNINAMDLLHNVQGLALNR